MIILFFFFSSFSSHDIWRETYSFFSLHLSLRSKIPALSSFWDRSTHGQSSKTAFYVCDCALNREQSPLIPSSGD